ncbi:hypothetical protein SAMN05414137_11927 [Streptacidiphilus jiangxiensis]|uniref:Uncharacterized protein n=1 Tax=Streptacidiphilus jiangxiensis TaxID=235985 RepID=A0A1H7VVE8_STRJI|nr:hypothetical protein SAMN05414137_11927 [Streptacidiphilus jiangxiensis]
MAHQRLNTLSRHYAWDLCALCVCCVHSVPRASGTPQSNTDTNRRRRLTINQHEVADFTPPLGLLHKRVMNT